jgi:hypothetical protein
MATSKLTRCRSEGFSKRRAKTFSLNLEFQPPAFIATAAEMSLRIPSGVRSEMDKKSLLFKIDLLYATSIS